MTRSALLSLPLSFAVVALAAILLKPGVGPPRSLAAAEPPVATDTADSPAASAAGPGERAIARSDALGAR